MHLKGLSAFITSIQHLNIMQEINREKCVSRQLWQNPLLVIASLFIVMLKFRCFAFWNVNDINTQCCIRIGWDVFVFFFSKAALQWAYLFSSPWGKLNNRYLQKSVALRRISKYWLFYLFLPPFHLLSRLRFPTVALWMDLAPLDTTRPAPVLLISLVHSTEAGKDYCCELFVCLEGGSLFSNILECFITCVLVCMKLNSEHRTISVIQFV